MPIKKKPWNPVITGTTIVDAHSTFPMYIKSFYDEDGFFVGRHSVKPDHNWVVMVDTEYGDIFYHDGLAKEFTGAEFERLKSEYGNVTADQLKLFKRFPYPRFGSQAYEDQEFNRSMMGE